LRLSQGTSPFAYPDSIVVDSPDRRFDVCTTQLIAETVTMPVTFLFLRSSGPCS
jgi:hypothetical protein